jgi:hypothetical protein
MSQRSAAVHLKISQPLLCKSLKKKQIRHWNFSTYQWEHGSEESTIGEG